MQKNKNNQSIIRRISRALLQTFTARSCFNAIADHYDRYLSRCSFLATSSIGSRASHDSFRSTEFCCSTEYFDANENQDTIVLGDNSIPIDNICADSICADHVGIDNLSSGNMSTDSANAVNTRHDPAAQSSPLTRPSALRLSHDRHGLPRLVGHITTLSLLICAVLFTFPIPTIAQPLDLSDQEYQRQQEIERLRRDQMKNDAPSIHLTLPQETPLQKEGKDQSGQAIQKEQEASLALEYPINESPCRVIDTITLRNPTNSNPISDNGEEGINNTMPPPQVTPNFNHLLSAVSDAKGKCLGASGIQVIVSKLQNALIREGYVTTRVFASPQDLSNGNLEVTILPGRVAKIAMPEGYRIGAILGAALPIEENDLLNIRDIEQGIENLRRPPTVMADIKIAPGANEGDSDLIVDWQQRFPIRFSLALDDSGSEATGKYQGNATLSLDNLLGLSDIFYVGVSKSLTHNKPYGTEGKNLYYAIPFGYNQVSISASKHNYYQTVAGYMTDYVYSGDSANVNLTYSRVLMRSATGKTTGSFGIYYSRSHNFIDHEEIEVQKRRTGGWEIGLSHEEQINKAQWEAELKIKRGTRLMEALPAPEEAFEEGTAKPLIVTGNLRLSVPLLDRLRYTTQLRAQWARNVLIARDRFSIGGRYTVRGYDGEYSLSADNGYILKNDISWWFQVMNTRHELYAGVDVGHVFGKYDDLLIGRTLSGAAQGVRGQVKSVSYDFFISQPLTYPENFHKSSWVAGVNASLTF